MRRAACARRSSDLTTRLLYAKGYRRGACCEGVSRVQRRPRMRRVLVDEVVRTVLRPRARFLRVGVGASSALLALQWARNPALRKWVAKSGALRHAGAAQSLEYRGGGCAAGPRVGFLASGAVAAMIWSWAALQVRRHSPPRPVLQPRCVCSRPDCPSGVRAVAPGARARRPRGGSACGGRGRRRWCRGGARGVRAAAAAARAGSLAERGRGGRARAARVHPRAPPAQVVVAGGGGACRVCTACGSTQDSLYCQGRNVGLRTHCGTYPPGHTDTPTTL